MRTGIVAAILVWSVVLRVGLDVAGAEERGAVFVADFDGSVVARGANGEEIRPLKAEGVEFAPGLHGQALRADGCLVTYPADVVAQERGTLVMWLSPLEQAVEGLWLWRIYFGDAEQWGPLGMPRLWLWGSILRFDFDKGKWWEASLITTPWS